MMEAKIAAIQKHIAEICRRIGRDPNQILILAATKSRSVVNIKSIIQSGITTIGENRVQELLEKLAYLPKDIRIDFIGHLQSNKVKDVVNNCELIHSVDRIKLTQIIDREAEKAGKIQQILLEVNIAGESTKYGFKPSELEQTVRIIPQFKNVALRGLMTMAPHFPDPEHARPVFSALRKLRDKLEVAFRISLPDLSMGMSNDYQIAIEEGATIIRLGRILFNVSS